VDLKHTWHFVVAELSARARWAWIVLLSAVLAVYLRTLSPSAVGGDPGELQFVPYILSIPHPTGTPLYILLGKLWSALPLGPTVAWRMNLLAAFSATLAVFVVYHIVYAQYERPVPALAAALSLAFGLTFWEQALLADKYAFNALLVALVLYLALRWGRTRAPRALNLLALTYGLSLAHHRTMALFAPVLLGYVWWHERGALWRDGRRLLRLGALVLAPLLLYFYLPWGESRNLPPGTWHPRTAREWYDYLFDTGRTGLVYVDPDDLGEMLLFYARTLRRDFTWVGVLLGIGGVAWQFRRRPADALFLLVNYVAQAFLAANHHVPRHWVYFIPSFLIYALWVGEALSAIWLFAEQRWSQRSSIPHPSTGSGCQPQFPIPNPQISNLLVPVLLAMVILAWPLVPFPKRYRPLRQAHLGAGVLDVWRQTLKTGHMGDRIGKAIASVAPDAVIVCDWEQATPLWYYQQVEGLRPDVQIVYPVERLDEAAALGRPLYLARAHAGLADRWHPSCSGSLIALHPAPAFDLPPDVAPLSVWLQGEGGAFEVAGYAYGEATFHPGTVVPLTLYWRALEVPAHDYSVSLRLFDGGGGQVSQMDSQHPVLGTYPTSRWAAGEVVGDYYEFQLPPDLSPGAYQWGAILYRALPEGGWESLKVAGTEGEVAMGAAFEVWKR
jgi:hypothetical protein